MCAWAQGCETVDDAALRDAGRQTNDNDGFVSFVFSLQVQGKLPIGGAPQHNTTSAGARAVTTQPLTKGWQQKTHESTESARANGSDSEGDTGDHGEETSRGQTHTTSIGGALPRRTSPSCGLLRVPRPLPSQVQGKLKVEGDKSGETNNAEGSKENAVQKKPVARGFKKPGALRPPAAAASSSAAAPPAPPAPAAPSKPGLSTAASAKAKGKKRVIGSDGEASDNESEEAAESSSSEEEEEEDDVEDEEEGDGAEASDDVPMPAVQACFIRDATHAHAHTRTRMREHVHSILTRSTVDSLWQDKSHAAPMQEADKSMGVSANPGGSAVASASSGHASGSAGQDASGRKRLSLASKKQKAA